MTAPKVVCQYRRASKLAAAFAARWPDPNEAVDTAELLSPIIWHRMAERAGITPPSPDTIALTIELLRERTTKR